MEDIKTEIARHCEAGYIPDHAFVPYEYSNQCAHYSDSGLMCGLKVQQHPKVA